MDMKDTAKVALISNCILSFSLSFILKSRKAFNETSTFRLHLLTTVTCRKYLLVLILLINESPNIL